MNLIRREKIRVNGIVQGVGFRPFVYRLARDCDLAGFVHNNSEGVLIEVEGTPNSLQRFRSRLHQTPPPLAQIVEFQIEVLAPRGEQRFSIQSSECDALPQTLISPDAAVCEECLQELFDPKNRRYHYPFINCTNCGPRHTIVRSLPYDRPFTSMAGFPMCEPCQQEYDDPANRRFHAQPNACPDCGPHLSLLDNAGKEILSEDLISEVVRLLRLGRIIAIKGLGGFHLAVDARNDCAVQELRRRKGRAEKPFALMAPDIACVKRFCFLEEEEEETDFLQRPMRPIVLLPARPGHPLAPSVAPRNRYLGFMLPYTPLHYLLLWNNFQALVMTSGNFSEEPIVTDNAEALERLAPLADFFLLHDRDILQRCDDSIVRYAAHSVRLLRRSRGYVPRPVFLQQPTRKRILACGGELKNTIALSRSDTVFLSQHIGDLDNPAALAFFENSVRHFQNILEIKPDAIAYDLHPEYLSTKWAMQQEGLEKVGVQHHHAHLASVLAENRKQERAIGIILDGAGYGADGAIWGGEILIGDLTHFERFAWLAPTALPGGAAAIRQPWRMALSYLFETYGQDWQRLKLPFCAHVRDEDARLILQMIEKRLNTPITSSCGRLFDAVAALLGLRTEINYEAQAAIELEMSIDERERDLYREAIPPTDIRGPLAVSPMFRAIVADVQHGEPTGRIAARFHRTLAELFLAAACSARQAAGIEIVALSGGVFQNIYFFTYMLNRLREEKFQVLTHKQVPCNDGGLSLGQVVIADRQLEQLET
ncbi:MAG: carbamoyltransferase HypF [bacterium]